MKTSKITILFIVYIAILTAVVLTVACEGRKEAASNEQPAIEETETETIVFESEKERGEYTETIVEIFTETESVEDAETLEKDEPTVESVYERVYQDGIICGHVLREDINRYLQDKLIENDIEYWYQYALAQCFQESSFNDHAEARNGLDKGLFQYRITYWDFTRGDIFDYHAQIDRYVEEVRRRRSAGCSIWETISRHKTSDYGLYDETYVNQVMQWIAPE